MSRKSNRQEILTKGLRFVHERGFASASVRDIVEAAGVPQGSFTNHFASKEAFGLEILNLYFANASEVTRQTLRNEALPPLERLAAWIDSSKTGVSVSGQCNGCLLGNLAAEVADHSEALRTRLLEIFAEVQAAVTECLAAATHTGDLPQTLDCNRLAAFIVASLQGANLLAKVQGSMEPVERFKQILFAKVLR